MLKMSAQIENIVSAYKTLAKIPSVVGGKLNNKGTKITSKWSIRNLDKGKASKYLYNYSLDANLNVINKSDFGTDVSSEFLSSVSPRETFKVVIREEKNGTDKKEFLEIWSKSGLEHSVNLTALELHGDVYGDSEFGCLNWSADESSVVYVAERKLKKSEPYIKRKGADKNKQDDGSGESQPKKGEEYIYRQDWGEQLVGKYLSSIVVCKVESETFTVHDLPGYCCAGQVQFSIDSKTVVGVAWETEPRRLGLIFCTNRPGYIFEMTLDGKLTKLSKEGMAVRSPRISPTGDIFWLQRVADGPHHACHAIVKWNRQSNEVSTVVDVVQTESKTSNDVPFYGVYNQALPKQCFSSDGKRIVFSTPQQTEVKSYVVDVDGGRIVDISIKKPGSTAVLDVKNDVILASWSNMTTPPQLFVARLPVQGSESGISWLPVSKPIEAPTEIVNSTVEYLNLQHEGTDDSTKSFTSIYFAPKGEGNRKHPLIVWPHGGPHSNFVNSFMLEAALFNMLGFATVQVNYRGSTGSGQSTVYFLPKRVGESDVKDCKLATDFVTSHYKVDDNKLCLFGGSHGGFLVTHLSGQYPDTYKVVVSRNPVIDVATMYNSSDIPDWCAVEAGYEFIESGPVSEDHLLAMRRCSPLAHVHKVRAPTALMLGAIDKRVPHYQGLEYGRRLMANGVPTRIYMYEDNHSLSKPPSELDNLVNSARWFFEHIET